MCSTAIKGTVVWDFTLGCFSFKQSRQVSWFVSYGRFEYKFEFAQIIKFEAHSGYLIWPKAIFSSERTGLFSASLWVQFFFYIHSVFRSNNISTNFVFLGHPQHSDSAASITSPGDKRRFIHHRDTAGRRVLCFVYYQNAAVGAMYYRCVIADRIAYL